MYRERTRSTLSLCGLTACLLLLSGFGLLQAQESNPSLERNGQQESQPKEFDLTFDDLKFEMDKDEDFHRSMLTEDIKSYHGATVKLRGYMRPNYKQTGLTKFIFVRDNQECCFGPKAAIYDNVLVRLAEGKKADYTVRPVVIEGKFALKEYKGPDGKVWSLYRMYQAELK